MGSEELSFPPKLPLFSIPNTHMQSPERSGMLTPPLHTYASVPFRWEEEPGKPKPSTALTTYTNPNNDFTQKLLELPPRLLLDSKITKLPSPTTVLDGPYIGNSIFQSSSFRMISGECYGSFRSSSSPERGQLGAMILSNRGQKEKGFLGSWRRRTLKVKREVGGGSCVFPSSVDRDSDGNGSREVDESSSSANVKITRIKRAGSFTNLSHAKSHFWATIYEGLKHVVVPRRNRKVKKDGFVN